MEYSDSFGGFCSGPMQRYTFNNEAAASHIENAVKKLRAAGYCMGDIFEKGTKCVSCYEMGDQIVAAM